MKRFSSKKTKELAPGVCNEFNIEQALNKYIYYRMASDLINSLQGRIIGDKHCHHISYKSLSLSLSLSVSYAQNHTRGMSRERQALGVGVPVLPKMKRKRESLKALSIGSIVHRAQ